jgi:hypothetical protein
MVLSTAVGEAAAAPLRSASAGGRLFLHMVGWKETLLYRIMKDDIRGAALWTSSPLAMRKKYNIRRKKRPRGYFAQDD